MLLFPISMVGQGTVQQFGKNRVQYSDDFKYWNQYESQNFITYYYGKARGVADLVVQLAEANNESIREVLEYRFNEKIEIIVYANITDFKQSNIGNDEIFQSVAGQTKIVGNKMFVYYQGDFMNLQRQIREGITLVYLQQMQVGSSLQDFVQNAVQSDLPDWYVRGMVAFVGVEWDEEVDNQCRQYILSETYNDFYELARDYPKLAGHMFWYYVHITYGEEAISNLLYLNRINRRLESSFLYSLSIHFEDLVQNTFRFFQMRYTEERTGFDSLPRHNQVPFRNTRNLPITNIAMHPDGKQFAFVTNEIGQYKVYAVNTRGEIRQIAKRKFRNPFQVTDVSYPILQWNPQGTILGMISERRDVRYFEWWDFRKEEKGKMKLANALEQVYSFDFYDRNTLVLSAAERGIVDLYLFNLRNRSIRAITDDYYDDHDVRVAELFGRKGILFSSNRTDNTLGRHVRQTTFPSATYDLFFLDISEDAERLDRLTLTPTIDERQPQYYDDRLWYVSTHSGSNHLFSGPVFKNIDTIGQLVRLTTGREIRLAKGKRLTRINPKLVTEELPWIDTVFAVGSSNFSNFHTSIQHLNISGGVVLFSVQDKAGFSLFKVPIAEWSSQMIQPTAFSLRQQSLRKRRGREQKERKEDIPPDPRTTPKYNYKLQSLFSDPPGYKRQDVKGKDVAEPSLILPTFSKQTRNDQKDEVLRFSPSRAIAYRLRFRFESFTTNVDNQPLFGGLNTFAGTPQGFDFPPLGLLGKFTVSDLFEDYEITAGARIPTTFNGTEFFIYADDNKKRIDKRYALYRRVQRFSNQSLPNRLFEEKFTNLIGIYQLKYPFDIYRSLRLINTLRFDNYNVLASDRNTLSIDPINTQRFGVQLAYVYDNTYLMRKNMLNGTRYKIWIEGVNRFQIQFSPWSLSVSDDFMTIIGLDGRHYQRLGRHAIIAARVAGSTSFGSEQLLFFMGGVDNWLFAQNSTNIGIPEEGNFAFNTLAANMRGFKQNARNGASYVLFNSEIRVAPFNYFTRRRIRSAFLRNFQIVGFFDAGTAWYGLSPFSDDNPLNTVVVESPPTVIATINYFRDPIIFGLGAGVRLDLFGYFIRADYAWGFETKRWQDPILYLSIGQDF